MSLKLPSAHFRIVASKDAHWETRPRYQTGEPSTTATDHSPDTRSFTSLRLGQRPLWIPFSLRVATHGIVLKARRPFRLQPRSSVLAYGLDECTQDGPWA